MRNVTEIPIANHSRAVFDLSSEFHCRRWKIYDQVAMFSSYGWGKKETMRWRHCTDARQMQRRVHRPSPSSPRSLVTSPSLPHPRFHENNDVIVSGPWIHLRIPRSVNLYSSVLSNTTRPPSSFSSSSPAKRADCEIIGRHFARYTLNDVAHGIRKQTARTCPPTWIEKIKLFITETSEIVERRRSRRIARITNNILALQRNFFLSVHDRLLSGLRLKAKRLTHNNWLSRRWWRGCLLSTEIDRFRWIFYWHKTM